HRGFHPGAQLGLTMATGPGELVALHLMGTGRLLATAARLVWTMCLRAAWADDARSGCESAARSSSRVHRRPGVSARCRPPALDTAAEHARARPRGRVAMTAMA